MSISRYLELYIRSDALPKKKMAFITGPRQVGKSTLAKTLLQHPMNYFLYDEESFRRAWAKSPREAIGNRDVGPIILDEIHKDRRWKSKVKGIYDHLWDTLPVIVTGSARFDYFRKGSDSLMGRYLPYRLHPLSVAETAHAIDPGQLFSRSQVKFPWNDLMQLGGFPEPLLGGSESEAQRWSRLRQDRLVLEDCRDFRNISDLNAFRVLTDLLPERVGSLLSVNALREDVGKAYATVRSWIMVLDVLYYVFLVRPYSTHISRALKAEPKLYLYDILRIPPEMASKRTENLTALHLLKACHFWTDTAQGEFELKFVRNKDQREVDFLVTRDQKPWLLLECKSNKKSPADDLIFFTRLLKPKYSIQLVSDPSYDRLFSDDQIRVMNYELFLSYWL